MANVIVKSDERRRQEATTLRQYGVNPVRATAQQREWAESISRRTRDFEHKVKAQQ